MRFIILIFMAIVVEAIVVCRRSMLRAGGFALGAAAALLLHGSAAAEQGGAGLAPVGDIAAFAKKNCLECHDGDAPEGGFGIEDLLVGPTVERNVAGWHGVLERLVARDMPPKDHDPRPTEKEYAAAEEWIRSQLEAHEAFAATQRPRPLRRLNSDEYNRTIREVFGIEEITPADDFPPDDSFEGFTNIGEALNLSSVLVEQYLAAGDAVARMAVVDGEQPKPVTKVFTDGNKDYGLTIRGHDPGGAIGETDTGRAWLGDHLYVSMNGPAGYYKVRIKFTPKNLSVRPGYVPHFQIRFDQSLVASGDLPIQEGQPAVYEAMALHSSNGAFNIDFRWANGFPNNNGLRAESTPRKGPDGKPIHGTTNTWDLLNHSWAQERKKNPSAPYPFPYFKDLAVEVEGPLFPEGWPLSRFQRENAAAIAAGDGKPIATWLLPKLYRRPATATEIADFAKYVTTASRAFADPKPMPTPSKEPLHDALRLTITKALVSPHFLFHVEPGPVGRTLTDRELAVRLSYFLWSCPPDEELTSLANANKLRPALAEQVRRMIADPRSAAFVERFTGEWLGLSKLATIMPEQSLYKRFDLQGLMRKDFAEEPRAMMNHLLRENGSLYDLLDCDYAFLNDRLADHYHLPSLWPLWPMEVAGFLPVSGGTLRKVKLPEGRRGGLVTTAAFLASASENTRTSPVRRGVWILEKIFNRPPPPPPPNVNAVLPDSGDGDTASSLVLSHVSAANCAGCHARIDPLGMALEHYDVIGEWRDEEPAWVDPANPARNREAVQKKFKLYAVWTPVPTFPIDDGFRMGEIEGKGPDALKRYLLANKDRFARGFTEKLASYALGRRHLITDEAALKSIRETAMKDDFRLQTLILALVQSELFQVH
jgi:mono/diheme cytochrome c family protein